MFNSKHCRKCITSMWWQHLALALIGVMFVMFVPNRRRLFVEWLFDRLALGVLVVSTVVTSSLKYFVFIWRGIMFVIFIMGMMAMGRVVLAETVDFNVTAKLSYYDYKLEPHPFRVSASGSSGPNSCHNSVTEEFSLTVPFQQDVILEQSSSASKNCEGTSVKYRQSGGTWENFVSGDTLNYEGLLELQLYSRNDRYHLKCRTCNVDAKVTFFGEFISQEKGPEPFSFSIPATEKGKKEVTRVSIPTSQFDDNGTEGFYEGVIKDLKCQANSDKPSEVKLWCERDADQFVIYAYSIKAVDVPLAPLASIDLVKSSGEKDGVIKAVKWKDDEFLSDDENHEPIEFIGQAIDIDGEITEYIWISDKDGIISNQSSFFYSNLSLGQHIITFTVKDNDGLLSNETKIVVDVIRPHVLLVHGLQLFNSGNGAESWKWDENELVGNGYTVHKIQINPGNERFSYGAKKVEEKIKSITSEYGIPKVNIIAHSMGGINSRWYIQNPGYRNDINKLVMLGTPNHGSTWAAAAKPSISKSHAFAAMLDIIGLGAGIGSGFLDLNGPKLPLPVSGTDLLKGEVNPPDPIGGAIVGAIGGVVAAVAIGIAGEKFGGPALSDLVPQSSALKSLNRNKKDEGYSKHQADDNIQTVYGTRVLYFNVTGRGFTTISHKHIIIPVVEWDIVLPKISTNGDLIVHNNSAKLDNIPSTKISDAMHMGTDKEIKIPIIGKIGRGLTKHEEVLDKALYYLGDDPPEILEDEKDSSKALAGHAIYATNITSGKEFPIILAGETQEQTFEVDSTIKNLDVTIMGLAKDDKIPSLKLLSPSGIIDENTTLLNVEYINDSINATYHITDVESGAWTAIIESSSDEFSQYVLTATGETDFWVGVVEGTQVEPGAPFTIQAYAQKEGNPMSGLDVSAMLIKTLDEGERIGSKYGPDLRDVEPITVDLTDLGDGRYEIIHEDTIATGVYRVFITANDPATDTSRVTLTTFFVEYDYELTVQSKDIVFSNDAPEHNETITVSANVHNESNIDAKGVEVWFADGRLDQGGAVFAKKTLDNIAANNTAIISTSWIATADTKEVFVIVSPMNTFIETNVDNNTASKAINPLDLPPVADAGMDQKARFDKDTQTNVHIFLDGSGSADELKIERYEWDINTNVDSNGDGINDNDVDLTGVHPFIPAGTYTTLGEYEVKLTVFDIRNQSHSDTLTIQHTEEYDFEAPIADAGLDQIVTLKTPVYFDGSKSSDNYGIATYTWDIDTNTDSNGDGIADNDVDLIGTHPVLDGGYEEKGIYTVQLTVRDVAGNDPATDTLIVEINKPLTYSVSCYVQDEFGNPVTDVLVEINNQETTTDENGYYQINELVEGEYTVTAKAQSHNFKPQTVQVGSENPGLELNFTASKAPIDAPILYLVIDDTGSMRDNINGVQQALTEYIEILQQAILEGKISPLSVLLTFKDQDEIYSRIVTDNLNELLEQVKLLEAEGGDDCAEDSVVALNQVAAEIAEGGTILLATDAPPHEGYDELTTLIEQLRDKGITINIILTEAYCVDEEATTRRRGDGSDHFEKSIEAYSRIANEVGNGSSLSIIKRSAKKPAPEEWLQAYKDVALNIMLGTIQPTVTTVSPTHVPQGGTLDLYITAANANFNKSSFVHIDGGIKVNKIHSVSPNQIIANVTIPANTDLNRYDMRINTSLADGSIETTHGIGVIAVEAAPENPEIISIASLQNGLQLLISGINTHFEPDVTLLKFDDANITIARLTVHNETLLEARLYVTDNARLGLHDITITTGDEVVSKNQLPIFIITSPNATNATPAPMAKYCDSLGEVITISCHNQVLGDKHIGPKGYVTHGDIAGKVTSEGWVSSVTILPNAMLDGGIVTGNIDNQGTVANIDYRGGSLTGGNLAGDIIVNDEITESNLGLFRNVTLLQGANINGGIFEGIVTGKGSIKNAFFRANVKLSGVTIGEGCRFAEGVDIGTGVRFTANDLIPEETDLSAALTTYGEIDFSTDVVMDAPSLLNQINALPDMQDNNWQLEQNDGRLEVMVNGTRMRVKPKRVKQAKRNRRAAIIIHGDGTVTVITAKGREILVEVE